VRRQPPPQQQRQRDRSQSRARQGQGRRQPHERGQDENFEDGAVPDEKKTEERLSIFDGDWGPESIDDEWCFMRNVARTTAEMEDSYHYRQLMSLAQNYGNPQHGEPIEVCQKIQRYYDDNFKAYMDPERRRPWTLRSIHAWLQRSSPAKNFDAMLDQACRTHICRLLATKRQRDPETGRIIDQGDKDNDLFKWIALRKRLEQKGGSASFSRAPARS
jgi:hypothetical protein